MRKALYSCGLCALTVSAFATSTDTTFTNLYNQLDNYLTGSLGNVILIVCLLAVVVAITGFASMKVLFTALMVAMVIHYGPDALQTMAGTGAETTSGQFVVHNSFGWNLLIDLVLLGIIICLGIDNQKLRDRRLGLLKTIICLGQSLKQRLDETER